MSVLTELRAIVGPGHLLDDPEVRSSYERDITGRFAGRTLAVVRPGSVAEVAAVVRACARAGQRLVVRGGGTGLVGGAVPLSDDELVLSLERLTAVTDCGDGSGDLIAEAGVTLAQLHAAAAGAGAMFALDFAARDTATVGGMIATNAAGPLALRYGPMRAQLAGMEIVLASGERLRRLSGLKDTAGYDWSGLIVGSEGTLGVLTRARLRLRPLPRARAVALLGLAAVDDAARLAAGLRRLTNIEAIDCLDARSMRLVCAHRRLTSPVGSHAWYLVIQVEADDPVAVLDEALREYGANIAVAEDTARRAALWDYRDAVNESVAAAGVPHKFDVSVPLPRIGLLLAAIEADLAAVDADAELVIYGHLGNGNLHVNVLGLAPGEERADAVILQRVAEHGGSISAEHGIGIAKRAFLHLARPAEEISLMRVLKAALDPKGLLGAGRVLPAGAERGAAPRGGRGAVA